MLSPLGDRSGRRLPIKCGHNIDGFDSPQTRTMMGDNRFKHRPTAGVSRSDGPSLSRSSSRFERRRARSASKTAPTGAPKPSVTNAPDLHPPVSGSSYGVQYLKELYTVVVGLAIALPFEHLVREQSAESPLPERPALLLFFAFLITLVPFYHGSMTHLDKIHVEKKDLTCAAARSLPNSSYWLFRRVCSLIFPRL
jgi:hypothetical protein